MSKVKIYLKDNLVFIMFVIIINSTFFFGFKNLIEKNFINVISIVLINLLSLIHGKIDVNYKIYYFINSIISLFLMNTILKINTLEIDFLYLILNFLIIYSVYLFFNLLKTPCWLKILFSNIVLLVFTLSEFYILKFRGTPLVIRDLVTLKSGITIANNYKLFFDNIFFTGIFVLIFMIVLSFKVNLFNDRILNRSKIFISYLLIVCYIFLMMDSVPIDNKSFRKYGPMVTFISDYKSFNIEKPETYNEENALKTLGYINKNKMNFNDFKSMIIKNNDGENKKPNIIVIMSEALFDMNKVIDFETNKDYMPFLHNFKNMDNTYTGYVTTPTFGGGTCNSEFEFLTNHSMSFLGRWVYPYQDYIKTNQDTIVSTLDSYGYKSIAVHAFTNEMWRRSEVYEHFGFDDFIYSKDFDSDVTTYRTFISDEAMFDKIIEIDKNNNDEPLFIFGVTMQNHGAYDFGYKGDIKVKTDDGYNHKSANEYFSLVRKSDEAFKKFIEYYENVEEDTIILMFGDHAPAYVYNDLIRDNDVDVASYREHYDTPFYIWANYDIDEGFEDNISLNYLNLLLFEKAGLEFNSYQKYLSELRKEYPNINVFMDTKNDENLDEYENLQYYMLFEQYKEKAES